MWSAGHLQEISADVPRCLACEEGSESRYWAHDGLMSSPLK